MMKLMGKPIKNLTPEKLKRLCVDWAAFSREPMAYKDTVVHDMVVQYLNRE